MDDILSQGGDREPSPWPRRLAVIGALALVLVGGIVYLVVPRHPRPPSAAVPAPTGLGRARRDRRADPAVGCQPPAAGHRDAARVVLARHGPLGADRRPACRQLRLPVHPHRRRLGGAAQLPGKTAHDDYAVPPLPVWFLADGAQSVTRVGTANQVAPAATAGALWLTSYPLGANAGTAAGTAREVSLAGAPLGAPVRLPPGYVIDQATRRGLLLAPVIPRPGTSAERLWDTAAPQDSRTFDAVIAATPTEIAWAPACAALCRVQVLDLATGRQTAVELPKGSSAASGAFSPSGGFLALQLSLDNTGDDGALAMRLEVASVTSGRLTAVPETFVSSDALVGFGWPANSDSLVAEFIFTTKAQLASWHPGASRLAVTVIPPGPDQALLIVG